MNFLADEGVEREIVDALRRLGHTVLYVAEMSPGITDDAVLDQANTTSSILITSDKDFGELVFRQKRIHQGVVLTRLDGLSVETRPRLLPQWRQTLRISCRMHFQLYRAGLSEFVNNDRELLSLLYRHAA